MGKVCGRSGRVKYVGVVGVGVKWVGKVCRYCG